MRRSLLFGALACVTLSAWGGEIIFVDPVREKAQRLQPPEDEAVRHDQLRERVMEDARNYRDDAPAAPPAIIYKSAPPPTDAAKARQTARGWVVPPAASPSGNRCKTENTVGGIEGSAQGHTVIQGTTSDVKSVCK